MSNIVINDNSNEIIIDTVSGITYNGINFKPSFDSEGLKIPMILNKINSEGTSTNMVYYQRIPKNIIVDILKEYIPEILSNICGNNIKQNSNDFDDIIALTTYGSDTK